MVDIDTHITMAPDPWAYARKVFVRLLIAGVCAMVAIGYTDYLAGLSTRFDQIMLPLLAVVSLSVAFIINRYKQLFTPALMFNAGVLLFYFEGLFFVAVQSSDAVSAYTMASIAQFFPGLYIGIFVFFRRHAALVCWLIYASIAVQCGYGLLFFNGQLGADTQRQIIWAVLAAHPCCIVMLSFMTHLRELVEQAKNESVASKERFLAVVSHEVRSPLQTIVSSLELIEKAPIGSNIVARSIKRLMGAATLLEAQIRDLTAFTRLELTPDLNLAPVDLWQMFMAVEQTHQGAAMAKGLALRLELPQQSPTVSADESRLRQIVGNLVSNAIKYTAAGEVVIGFAVEDTQQVHMWVRDTGRGIAASQIQRIFEPFVRVKAHPTETIDGSGLGLAIVRQLVGLMRGRISVDSQEGQGSTMHIWLPLPILNTDLQTDDAKPRPRVVLVVDDDSGILQSMSDLLQAWGVQEVIALSDGESAVQFLNQRSVDVALLDLQLPGITGYEVARQARLQASPNRLTPIIAMSAIAMDKTMAGAEAFSFFIPKPLSQSTLIKLISSCT